MAVQSSPFFNLTGVVHLPPMPGYPSSPGLDRVIEFAIEEARTLERAGFTGVLIENEGDRPHVLKVSDEYIENTARMIRSVKGATKLPVGLEILYDMVGSVRAGIEGGADFVRLDVFTDDTEVRWGVVKGCTAEVAELRRTCSGAFPQLWADIHVKHGRNLSGRSLAESTRLAIEHGVDALIVTGTVTGEAPTIADCEEMRRNAQGLPVLVGSGFAADNASLLRAVCDGTVVASSVQVDGRFDLVRCQRLVEALAMREGATA
jgi:membrane complex biogenesis BtpA family protein